MRRFVFAIVWVLIVAIPVQAVAAVAMVHCLPASGGSAGGHAAALHQPPAGTVSHTHESVDSPATDHVHASIDSTKVGTQSLTTDTKCSACALCCVGGAPVSTSQAVAVVVPRDLPMLRPVDHLSASFDPGPERPPRVSLD
jgi:hypothetical protein